MGSHSQKASMGLLIEQNLTDFILEVALRFSALTDAGVFVIVETSEGRRFGGKGDLLRRFSASSGLRQELGDVGVDWNPNASPLDLKPETAGVVATSNKTEYGLYQKRTTYGFEDAPPSKRSKMESATNEAPPEWNDETPELDVEVKPSIEELFIDFDDEANEDPTTSSASYDIDWGHEVNSSDSIRDQRSNATDSQLSEYYSKTLDDDVGVFGDGMRLKEQALREMTDPRLAFVRGNVENKLLTSFFYDYGKNVTKNNPFPIHSPEGRKFFFDKVDGCMRTFPRLLLKGSSEMTALRSQNGSKRMYTPITFIKMNARNGYKGALKQRQREETEKYL